MQHLTSEQLVNLDDRAPSAIDKARSHLKTCALCYQEYAELKARRLQLQALPLASPRRSAWPLVQRSLRRRQTFRRVTRYIYGVSLAVCLGLVVYRHYRPQDRALSLPNELVAESQQLEFAIQKLDANTVTDLRHATEIVAMEQQIADIDDQLAAFQSIGQGPQSAPLWRDRIELLHALLEMHQSTPFISL